MVCLVIPALNEAEVIGEVVRSIPRDVVDEIIVVDNGSTDATAAAAKDAGATVVEQPARGYGRACRAGADAALKADADIVVFIDGDGSDCQEFMSDLVRPIQEDQFDFVIGSRTRGQRESGSLNPQQIFAAHLAGWLLTTRTARNSPICPRCAPFARNYCGRYRCKRRRMAGIWRCKCWWRGEKLGF
jgi:glycosyltransferase involved in cell wall biosynthesis